MIDFEITTPPEVKEEKTEFELIQEYENGEMSSDEFIKTFDEKLIYFDNKTVELNELLKSFEKMTDEERIEAYWKCDPIIIKDNGWSKIAEIFPHMAEDINCIDRNPKFDFSFNPWERENTDELNRIESKFDTILAIGNNSVFVNQLLNDHGYGEYQEVLMGEFQDQDETHITEYINDLISNNRSIDPLGDTNLLSKTTVVGMFEI